MAKHVLIIDDDEDTRIMYSLILKQAGYDVAEAKDGEIGVRRAQSVIPELVVLDIGLPRMSGWDVCKQLKADPRTAPAKIMVVTAHAHMEVTRKAEECKPDLLLTKPVSPFEVREHVRQLIGAGATHTAC